ncbi:NUDIX hydrolase [Nocardioides sp.]|uniref:NUDIX hydrolase n=1 Tax=Nocardioides sp. TaxID=35761 RepID=UPI003D14A241
MVFTSDYPIFSVTVDMVALSIVEDELAALVVRRGDEPFLGQWALPGGFVDIDEDLLAAAQRELFEETGVRSGDLVLEQLRTYGAPGRDPRGRMVSVAHLAVLAEAPSPTAGSDASHAEWVPVPALLEAEMAFDHHRILADGVERARSKLEYTTLATAFVSERFTLSELRHVYEVVWGRELDPGNFQRKVRHTEDFVEPTGETWPSPGGRGRPAAVHRAQSREIRALATPITRG